VGRPHRFQRARQYRSGDGGGVEGSMTFRQAVEATPNLGPDAFRPGLQALGAYSARIRCRNPRKLKGSVDIDAALQATDPSGHRWDYAVGHSESGSDRVYWVEVHPASDHGVRELLAKVA